MKKIYKGFSASILALMFCGVVSVGVANAATFTSGTWVQENSGQGNWTKITSSTDGTKLAAIVDSGYIYTSSDGGITWTNNNFSSGSKSWTGIASSADGTKLFATASGDLIYSSPDWGVTWTSHSSASGVDGWNGIASSSNGSKLVAISRIGTIYTSPDSGLSWHGITSPAASGRWSAISSSADGTVLAATVDEGGGDSYVYVSTNSGSTWSTNSGASGLHDFRSVAVSADGTKIVAGTYVGYIYTSSDHGVSWTNSSVSTGVNNWLAVASSSDGTKLAAVNDANYVYTSSDGGAAWVTQTLSGGHTRFGVASSGDGTKIFATAYNDYIYDNVVSSNWNLGTTWGVTNCRSSCSVGTDYPGTSDDAIIAHTTTLPADQSIHNLTINTGNVLDLNGHNLSVGGDWINNGTLSPNGGLLSLSGTSNVTIGATTSTLTQAQSIANLTISSGGTLTLQHDLTVTDLIINSGGTLDLNGHNLIVNGNITNAGTLNVNGSGTITISGDWNNSGTFNAGTGTVVFSGTSNSVVGATTFYNLTKTETSSSTIKFDSVSTITVSHTLTLTGASGQPLTVSSFPNVPYTFSSKWGSAGSSTGKFNSAHGIATDNENGTDYVYVADTKNNRIQKFSSSGSFVLAFGSAGTAESQFSQPTGIAIDASGNVYVADNQNNRIQKFNSLGVFQMMWGWGVADGLGSALETCTSGCHAGSGFGDGSMSAPHGMAFDSDGDLYVGDYFDNRIEKFSSSGVFLGKWGKNGGDGSSGSGNREFNGPDGIAIDADHNIYVADAFNTRVQKFDSSMNFLTQWGSINNRATYNTDGNFVYYPHALAVDSAGYVYVADTGNEHNFPDNTIGNRIEKFSSTGIYITKWGSYGTANSQFEFPYALSFDSAGDLFVVDSGNSQIKKFVAPSGVSGLLYVQGTAVASDVSIVSINNQGNTITCSVDCTDGGGNTGWSISSPATTPSVTGSGPLVTNPPVYADNFPVTTPTPVIPSVVVVTPPPTPPVTLLLPPIVTPPVVITYNFGTSTLRNGSRGNAVKQLQMFLNKSLNKNLTVDGVLGPKTVTVVKTWQKAHGLTADGLIGPKTKAMMNSEAEKN